MKNHFLSRFDAHNLRRTIIYYVIALSFIIISLVLDIDKNTVAPFVLFAGFVFFFYAVLHLWESAIYYGIMCIIFIILIILFWLVGMDILVKMQLPGKKAEEIVWIIMLVCIAGVIAGIIGMARWRKYD
jgi:hypothetical protein